jgi:hypothetical protein
VPAVRVRGRRAGTPTQRDEWLEAHYRNEALQQVQQGNVALPGQPGPVATAAAAAAPAAAATSGVSIPAAVIAAEVESQRLAGSSADAAARLESIAGALDDDVVDDDPLGDRNWDGPLPRERYFEARTLAPVVA